MNLDKTYFVCWKNFKNEKVKFFVIGVFLCFLIFYSGIADSHEAKSKGIGGEIKGRESASFQEVNFTLDSPEGSLSLKDFRGSVVLLFFGFTSCPDVCPISLSTLSHSFSYLTVKVAEIFGVNFEKKDSPDSALGYVIYHSSKIFVIGPQGALRKTIPHNTDSKLLSQQIRSLLGRNQL